MVTNVLKILFILQVIKLIWYPNISGWEEGYMYLLCGHSTVVLFLLRLLMLSIACVFIKGKEQLGCIN